MCRAIITQLHRVSEQSNDSTGFRADHDIHATFQALPFPRPPWESRVSSVPFHCRTIPITKPPPPTLPPRDSCFRFVDEKRRRRRRRRSVFVLSVRSRKELLELPRYYIDIETRRFINRSIELFLISSIYLFFFFPLFRFLFLEIMHGSPAFSRNERHSFIVSFREFQVEPDGIRIMENR